MSVPHRVLLYVLRLVSAGLAAVAALSIYSTLLNTVLAPLASLHPLATFLVPALTAAAALSALAGVDALAVLLIGVPAALVLALGYHVSAITAPSLTAFLVTALLARRVAVARGSGVRASRSCGRACIAATASSYLALGAAGYAAYALGARLGASIGAWLASLPRLAPEPLATLLRVLSNLYIVRLLVFALTAWLVYKVVVGLAEPVVYAVLASPGDARRLVDGLVEAELRALREGRAWHQKLLESSLSALLALFTIPLLYAAADAILAATPRLASNPIVARLYTLLYAAAPLTSLVVYIVARRALRGLARRLARLELGAPSPRPAAILAALAVATALLIAGPQATAKMLYTTLACPLTGACQPPEPRQLLEIGAAISRLLARAASDAAGIARLINALVAQAFQG